MARETVYDKWNNEIYLTDERWEHILELHDEMDGYRDHVLTTLRTGRRQQDAFDPGKYKYMKPFADLPAHFTHVVVVVKFSHRENLRGDEQVNNFVLTAYQVSRR